MNPSRENIYYDDWRQNIEWPSGRISENVLFIRARKENVEYYVPVFNDELIEDAKDILAVKVNNHFEPLA